MPRNVSGVLRAVIARVENSIGGEWFELQQLNRGKRRIVRNEKASGEVNRPEA